jgi:hypothetical protein
MVVGSIATPPLYVTVTVSVDADVPAFTSGAETTAEGWPGLPSLMISSGPAPSLELFVDERNSVGRLDGDVF